MYSTGITGIQTYVRLCYRFPGHGHPAKSTVTRPPQCCGFSHISIVRLRVPSQRKPRRIGPTIESNYETNGDSGPSRRRVTLHYKCNYSAQLFLRWRLLRRDTKKKEKKKKNTIQSIPISSSSRPSSLQLSNDLTFISFPLT